MGIRNICVMCAYEMWIETEPTQTGYTQYTDTYQLITLVLHCLLSVFQNENEKAEEEEEEEE